MQNGEIKITCEFPIGYKGFEYITMSDRWSLSRLVSRNFSFFNEKKNVGTNSLTTYHLMAKSYVYYRSLDETIILSTTHSLKWKYKTTWTAQPLPKRHIKQYKDFNHQATPHNNVSKNLLTTPKRLVRDPPKIKWDNYDDIKFLKSANS